MSNLESFGKVFFPDIDRDQILGAKLVSNYNETIIEFDSSTFKVPKRPEIILGEFTGIGPITCMENELYGIQSGEGGTRCKYKVSYLFTGIHFKRKTDVRFDAAVFQINSLVDWFDIRTFTHNFFPIKTIEFGQSQKIELEIKGFDRALFIFSHDFNSKRHSIEANETLTLSLTSTGSKRIDHFFNTLLNLKKLFAFLSNSTFIVDDISLYQIRKNIDPDKEDPLIKAKLYVKRQSLSPMPTSEFLKIKYIDIKEYFPSLVSKWLNLSKDNLVIDLLMEKSYNEELSDKTYFLNICFALEIYHKTNVNDQRLPIEEFEQIKKYFKKNIKNKAAKDWIDSKLGLGNHPSFRDRLMYFKNELGEIYYTDPETLINRIIHTRNSLVHSRSKSVYNITDEFELYLISITIETVIKGAILKKLGVESENVLKIFEETKKYIAHLNKRRQSEWLF